MSDRHSIRVIFVEDEEDVLLGSTQALDLAGFETAGFASVEQAQAHVSAGVPAVVVCDVKLPGPQRRRVVERSARPRPGVAGDPDHRPRRHRDGRAGHA